MLDDFFSRALIAGIGVAVVAGPLGCFIVWRRMAYFGDTMSHSALLGVALAFLLDINVTFGVFTIALLISLALFLLQRRQTLSSDSLLGLLSHSALALGLVCLGFMSWMRIDLMGFLFGDILAVSVNDILLVYCGGTIIIGVLTFLWRPLLSATVNEDLAAAEGHRPERTKLLFMLLLAIIIAVAMKIIGVLLITALLIIPAASARNFARTPEQMAIVAAVIGVTSVIGGLFGSLEYDTPSGPSIVVAALILFLVTLVPSVRKFSGRQS